MTGAAHAGARGSLDVGNVFTQSGARVFRIVNRATLLASADSFDRAAALDDTAKALEDHFIESCLENWRRWRVHGASWWTAPTNGIAENVRWVDQDNGRRLRVNVGCGPHCKGSALGLVVCARLFGPERLCGTCGTAGVRPAVVSAARRRTRGAASAAQCVLA